MSGVEAFYFKSPLSLIPPAFLQQLWFRPFPAGLLLRIHEILRGVGDADGEALRVLHGVVLVEVVKQDAVEGQVDVLAHLSVEADVETVVDFAGVDVAVVGEQQVTRRLLGEAVPRISTPT